MGTETTQTTLLLGRGSGWHLERVPVWEVAPQGIHSPVYRLEGVKKSLSPGSTRGWAAGPAIRGTAGMPFQPLGNRSLGGARVPLGLHPQLPVAKALHGWFHSEQELARSQYPHLIDRETERWSFFKITQVGGADLGTELGPLTESPCFLGPPALESREVAAEHPDQKRCQSRHTVVSGALGLVEGL